MLERYLREDVAAYLEGRDPFAVLGALPGETYREVAGRCTRRVVFDQCAYFLKMHEGVGWGEIFKNWVTLRRPVVSARNEFHACRQLAAAGLRAPVVAAFAERNRNPAQRRSFVLTDEITGHISLEDLVAAQPLRSSEQRRLVMAVAQFTRRFHGLGFIHRDYYICHLWLREGSLAEAPELTVIDLHRAVQFARIPRRWLVRDLAALLFSVFDEPLSPRSWLRFVRAYRRRPLPEVFADEGDLWRAVYQRALKLYRKGAGQGLVRGNLQPPW